MVINWKENIELCVEYTKVVPIFHAMPVEKRLQQILITKKLLELNYSNNQILNWFLIAEDECSKDLQDIDELILLAKKRRWPKSHNFTIYITSKEIEHIQKIKASKECKSFLLASIAFGKMMYIKRRKPTFNLRERSYIYYLATGRDDYNVGAQRSKYIQSFIKQLADQKEIKLKIIHTSISLYTGKRGGAKKDLTDLVLNATWIDNYSREGYEITSKNIENEIIRLCDLAFPNDVIKCKNCGKEFNINRKTKRVLCDDCYAEFVRASKREYARKVRKQKANVWTTEEDEKLKEIFSSPHESKSLKKILTSTFPKRSYQEIYNRSHYLGYAQKYSCAKRMASDCGFSLEKALKKVWEV